MRRLTVSRYRGFCLQNEIIFIVVDFGKIISILAIRDIYFKKLLSSIGCKRARHIGGW